MMAGSDEKPWESIWLALWRLTTGGRRRFITIPLFVLFVTMPAIAGFTDGLGKLRAFFYKPPTAPLSRDEWDVYEQDEWVLVLDTTNTFEQANKEREQFKIARTELDAETKKIRQAIEADVKDLEKLLDRLGAPYTPGRLPGGTEK